MIDKITILQIKRGKLTGEALMNVERELALLDEIADPILSGNAEIGDLASHLKALNENLWDIENQIRGKEAAGAFDAGFIELARAVYKHNDQRGALKRQISLKLGSELVEEKSYRRY